VKQAFYYEYASQWELKKNNDHLLTIKMKSGESLKQYVSYFQSQVALVYNDDVAVAAFISRLQVTHSYKHLLKHDVTKMRDILTRSQKLFKLRIVPEVLPTAPQARGKVEK